MAELRALFERAGCGSVRTHIVSGNVVFTSTNRDRDDLAGRLAEAVRREFDVPGVIVLRTFAEIGRRVASHPFGDDTSQTHVFFLERKLRALERRVLDDLDVAPDRVELSGAD